MAAKHRVSHSDVRMIAPQHGLEFVDPVELWRWRELFLALIVRDVSVRYKQTAVGIAWVVIQPLITVGIFAFLLGRIAQIPTDGLPYPLFALAGLVPWQVFSRALSDGSMSVVNDQSLVTKVYFPRVLMPAAAVCGSSIDFVITFVLLLVVMTIFGFSLTWYILLTPVLLLITLLTSLSVALWLSALNVLYRDVRYALPFLAQIWLFLTPVLYPTSVIPDGWRLLYSLNPMVSVTEVFRWSVLRSATAPDPVMLGISSVAIMALLLSGLAYFRYVERQMADRI